MEPSKSEQRKTAKALRIIAKQASREWRGRTRLRPKPAEILQTASSLLMQPGVWFHDDTYQHEITDRHLTMLGALMKAGDLTLRRVAGFRPSAQSVLTVRQYNRRWGRRGAILMLREAAQSCLQ